MEGASGGAIAQGLIAPHAPQSPCSVRQPELALRQDGRTTAPARPQGPADCFCVILFLLSGSIPLIMTDSAVTFLGTSCGFPISDRNFTALLLETGSTTILLDAGEPISRTLHQRGFDFSRLDAVCLSHGHSDHTGGFPMLIQTLWLFGRKNPLTVWLPSELIAPLQAWLEAVYLGPGIVPFPIEFHPWPEDRPVTLGELTIEQVVGTHLESFRARLTPDRYDRFRAHCFAFNLPGHRLVWSADIGAPADLLPLLQPAPSWLLAEVAHFPPESLFQLAADHGIQQLAATHFPDDSPEALQKLRNLAAEMLPTGSRFETAWDGLRLAW